MAHHHLLGIYSYLRVTNIPSEDSKRRNATHQCQITHTTRHACTQAPHLLATPDSRASMGLPSAHLAGLAEDLVPIPQAVPREAFDPRVHHGVGMHDEGVEVDKGPARAAPFRPAVMTVSGEIDHLRIPLHFIVDDSLMRKPGTPTTTWIDRWINGLDTLTETGFARGLHVGTRSDILPTIEGAKGNICSHQSLRRCFFPCSTSIAPQPSQRRPETRDPYPQYVSIKRELAWCYRLPYAPHRRHAPAFSTDQTWLRRLSSQRSGTSPNYVRRT